MSSSRRRGGRIQHGTDSGTGTRHPASAGLTLHCTSCTLHLFLYGGFLLLAYHTAETESNLVYVESFLLNVIGTKNFPVTRLAQLCFALTPPPLDAGGKLLSDGWRPG